MLLPGQPLCIAKSRMQLVDTVCRTVAGFRMFSWGRDALKRPTWWFLVYLSMIVEYQYSLYGSFLRSTKVLGHTGGFGAMTAYKEEGVTGRRGPQALATTGLKFVKYAWCSSYWVEFVRSHQPDLHLKRWFTPFLKRAI